MSFPSYPSHLRKKSLQEEVFTRSLRAKLVEVHFALEANHSSFLNVFANPLFFSHLERAKKILEKANCEVGMTFSLKKMRLAEKPSLTKANWGNLVVGNTKEISQIHDPFGEYFTHGNGRLPLLMLHFHPSERLGFSRSDCLAALTILRETKGMVQTEQCYRPIFAVGILKDSETVQILFVQSKHLGKFIEFKNLGQAYDAHAWLSCPYFNAAVVEFSKKGKVWVSKILEDTGITLAIS